MNNKTTKQPTGTVCCVPSCTNNTVNNRNVSFHAFPKDVRYKKEWIRRMNRAGTMINGKFSQWTPTKHHRICGAHFNENGKKKYDDKLPCIFSHKIFKKKYLIDNEKSLQQPVKKSGAPAVNSAVDKPQPDGEHFLAAYPFKTVTLPGSPFLEENLLTSASTSSGPPGAGTYNTSHVPAPKMIVIEPITPSPKCFALRLKIVKKFDLPTTTVTSAENVQNTLSSLCRLCTKPCSVFVQLYSLEPGEAPTSNGEKQISLTEKILAVTGMKLVIDGILPWHICMLCNRRIVKWYDFKKLCIANEIRFRSLAAEIAAPKVARETSERRRPTKKLSASRTWHKAEPSHHNYPPDKPYFADAQHESHIFVGAIEHKPQMNPVDNEFQCVSADLNDDSVDNDCKQLIQPSFSRKEAGPSDYRSFDDGTVSEIECKPQITSIQLQYLPQEQNASESGGIAADTDSQPVRIEPCFVSVKEEPIEDPIDHQSPMDENKLMVNRQSRTYQASFRHNNK